MAPSLSGSVADYFVDVETAARRARRFARAFMIALYASRNATLPVPLFPLTGSCFFMAHLLLLG
jgi:hypothetical protein